VIVKTMDGKTMVGRVLDGETETMTMAITTLHRAAL
jgi:hypothetical protein